MLYRGSGLLMKAARRVVCGPDFLLSKLLGGPILNNCDSLGVACIDGHDISGRCQEVATWLISNTYLQNYERKFLRSSNRNQKTYTPRVSRKT